MKPDGWHKHGQVWHLWRGGAWVAVVWHSQDGWRWHDFAESAPALESEQAAKAAAEAACRVRR